MNKRKETEWNTDTNFLNLLVKVTEVGSKMDGMTVAMETLNTNMKELRDGTKSDIEFLKVDKISRADAVRIQTDAMTAHAELADSVASNSKRITDLEDSRIAYRAQMRLWLIFGGGTWSLILVVLTVYISAHFHA